MPDMACVRRSARTLDETVEALKAAAEAAGWSVLAVHDLQERITRKGYECPHGLKIVEICSARYASQMVAANPRLALHLPCRMVVREDGDGVEIAVLSPTYVGSLFPKDELTEGMGKVDAIVCGIVNAAAETPEE